MLLITIDNTDRTRLVEYSSLKISNILTSHPDTAEFIVRKFGDRSYSPTIDDEVIINQDGEKIFAGHIVDIDETYDKLDYVSYRISCVDYTRHMDKKLLVATYTNKTVAQIIQDFIDNGYVPVDVTNNNVVNDTLIGYIAFNYEYPSDALRQLAEETNSDWYIDYDKDIHFFLKEATLSPFNLADTTGKYIYDSLRIRRDLSQIRNTIFVRGGEFTGEKLTVDFVGDGQRKTFYLPNKFSNLQVTVSGQIKNIGIDPLNDITNFDALHNFQERSVRFRDDKIPSDTKIVSMQGNPNIPVIVKMKDSASIGLFSAREYVVIDKSIKSKQGARDRALSELYGYKTTLSEGEFKTYTSGLRSGQKINIQSTLRGLNEDFVINRVDLKIHGTDASDGSTKLIYKVSLVTTRTFDIIQLLQKLLNSKNKEIVIDENDILDEVETVLEEMSISETVTSSVVHNPIEETMSLSEVVNSDLDYGEEYVFGLWTSGRDEDNGSKKRQFILDGSPLG